MEPTTPKSVRRRRQLAASLLSWALTLASVATLAAGLLLALTASPDISASMARDERVRQEAAVWVLSVVETTTGKPALIDAPELADAFDDAALADLLSSNITGVIDPDNAADVPLSVLVPTVSPEQFGLPEKSDLKLLPVLPDLSVLPGPLMLLSVGGGALAALLGLAAMLVSFPHQRSYVVARLGRWLLTASIAAAAVAFGASVFGASAGLAGAFAGAVGRDALERGQWVMIAGAGAGLLLIALAVLMRRHHAAQVIAQAALSEPTLPTKDEAVLPVPSAMPVESTPTLTLPTLAASPRPVWTEQVDTSEEQTAPVPTPHWARATWPQPIEGFVESEFTRELSAEELQQVAVTSCRAWVDGAAADPDDAEVLKLLISDRGNMIQLARLWARYDGQPRACANVILAYTDLALHVQEYSQSLGMPDWALTNRVGTLRRGVQEKGVPAFAEELRLVYSELAASLDSPLAEKERQRLLAISGVLSFAGSPA